MHEKLLNEEVVRLMEKYNVRPSELARRMAVGHTAVSHIRSKRKNLGEKLFLKILRKGFRLPEKEVRRIFTKAVSEKYLDDPELKS